MADQIAVTFGGREVVLEPTKIQGRRISLWVHERLVVGTLHGKWFAAHEWIKGDIPGDSPQAAASAVESKLRQLRSELDVVLGVPMDERTYFNLCDSLAAQLAECKDELRRK